MATIICVFMLFGPYVHKYANGPSLHMDRAGEPTSTHNCAGSTPRVAEKAGLVEVEKAKGVFSS